jgi:hypothetical protein
MKLKIQIYETFKKIILHKFQSIVNLIDIY